MEPAVDPPAAGWRHWRHDPALRALALRWRGLFHRPHRRELLGEPLTPRELGALGELHAARWLRRHRRTVLYRNYIGQHRGEVDLVCRHGSVLTFVEVKTRSSAAHGRPADAVTVDKQRLIQRGAQDWLRRLGHPPIPIRFDIVEVLLEPGQVPKFNLIANAFGLPDASLEGRLGQ